MVTRHGGLDPCKADRGIVRVPVGASFQRFQCLLEGSFYAVACSSNLEASTDAGGAVARNIGWRSPAANRIKVAARLATKYVHRTAIIKMMLPRFYRTLGRQIYEERKWLADFPAVFEKVDGLLARIKNLQATKPRAEGIAAKTKAVVTVTRDAIHAQALRLQVNHAFSRFGRAAFEKAGEQSGPKELIHPIKNALSKAQVLTDGITELSKSEPGQLFTPKRIAVAGAMLLVLVLLWGILKIGRTVVGTAPTRTGPPPAATPPQTTSEPEAAKPALSPSAVAKPPPSPPAHVAPVQENLPDSNKAVGDLKSLGDAFYNDLAFAHVSDGEPVQGLPLTKDFCSSGRRTYRRVTYDPTKTTMSAVQLEQMSSLGVKPKDCVFETAKTEEFTLTPGEPKFLHEQKDEMLLPLLKMGAMPGAEWEWEAYGGKSRQEPLYFSFKYEKAVKSHGTECVLIACEMRIDSAQRRWLVTRQERWYARGVGMVKGDDYAVLGGRGGSLTHIEGKDVIVTRGGAK